MQNVVNPIEISLRANISQENTFFVFPTQVSASTWADRATEISGKKAVATERFMAWDQFKGNSIRSTHQNKESIPSIMRSFFAENLIKQNAEAPFLHYIITEEYANKASVFSDYIAGLLPSLNLWKTKFEKKNLPPDQEDKDLLEIHSRYKTFLEKNNLFDPAWETPPFNADGKKYIIFFPEILMDYLEYKEILENTEDIILVHMGDTSSLDQSLTVHTFSSAREELHFIARHIRKLHEERNIPYTSICLSVPDLENYGPYIERELSLYEIPCVQKNGKALSATGAGSLFSQMQNCASTKFYFDSLKALLMNNELPWKNEELNKELIHFGKENNCLFDLWEESFEKPANGFSTKEVKKLYHELKNSITAITNSNTFSEIRKHYFSLREKFFDMEKCPPENDKIMSRCISELSLLIDMEESFPDCRLPSPFAFFTKYLSQTLYVPQNFSNGVQILPYRLASSAPFKAHLIMDASQSSLSTVYRQLSFLRDDKRILLGLENDTNISDFFIRLYSLSATDDILYTCSQKTFSGYAIPHNSFKNLKEEKHDDTDPLSQEKDFLIGKNSLPEEVTLSSKNSFLSYLETQKDSKEFTDSKEEIGKLIDDHFCKDGKFKISYSSLDAFYTCPRYFVLNRVLNVQEENNEASLMDQFQIGNLNHKILELFCNELKEKNLPLAYEDGIIPEEYKSIIKTSITNAIEKENISELARKLLTTSEDAIKSQMENCITSLSKIFNGFKVVETETSYLAPSLNDDYLFNGKIDCLLKDETEGQYYLVDFKSSDGAVHRERFYFSPDCDIPDFQIPMYLHILSSQEDAKKKKVENAGFFSVKSGKYFPVIGYLQNNQEIKYEDTINKFHELSDQFANKVKERDFSLPEDKDRKDCLSCAYKAICRRTFTVGRKKD